MLFQDELDLLGHWSKIKHQSDTSHVVIENLPVDVAIFSAAVADFKVKDVSENKIKNKENFSLSLEKNIDILKHVSNANLTSKINKYFKIKDLNKILSFMTKDKKNNSNKISLVLLKKIGYPIINREYQKNILSKFLKNELEN